MIKISGHVLLREEGGRIYGSQVPGVVFKLPGGNALEQTPGVFWNLGSD